jgi:glycosyltransferase involved in cell wall biosynthesis
MGKSWAMVHGVEKSQNEIILFFDADVSNIKKEHFDALLTPILKNEADMVLGQPSETLIDYKINPFKPLSGQRALRKREIVSILNDIRDIRFGIETYLNLYYQAQGKRIKYVLLQDLIHPTKYSKTTPIQATKEFIREGHEIATTLVKNHKLIAQGIELHLNKANAKTIKKINELQDDMDGKLQDLKNKFDKILKDK